MVLSQQQPYFFALKIYSWFAQHHVSILSSFVGANTAREPSESLLVLKPYFVIKSAPPVAIAWAKNPEKT